MANPIGIKYIDISKTYQHGGQSLQILHGVNFEVQPGEFVALMGPSGSGKSSLLNLTAGIDKPTSGRLLVGTAEPANMTERELGNWRLRNVGFVFQRYHLLNVLTAAENIGVPLLPFKMPKAERQGRVQSALELVELPNRAKSFPKQLSGGEQQRVAIARMIVNDPAVILADEPTGDLDTNSAHAILGLLSMLQRNFGKTIVMVTHDANAAKYANRTLYLHKGSFSEIQV